MAAVPAERLNPEDRPRWVPPLRDADVVRISRIKEGQEARVVKLPLPTDMEHAHHRTPPEGNPTTTDDSGAMLLNMMADPERERAIEELVDEHLAEIVSQSHLKVSQLVMELPLHAFDRNEIPSLSFRMHLYQSETGDAALAPAGGVLEDVEVAPHALQLDHLPLRIFFRDLVIEALEISQLDVTTANLERMLHWVDKILFADLSVSPHQTKLTQDQLDRLHTRVSNPDFQALHIIVMNLVLDYFDTVLSADGNPHVMRMPHDDPPSLSRSNRKKAGYVVLDALAAQEQERGEAGNILYERIMDVDPVIELRLDDQSVSAVVEVVDVISSFIKVFLHKSGLKFRTIPKQYLNALAERAITAICGDIHLSAGQELTEAHLTQLAHNIVHSNDPVMLATRDYVVHRSRGQ